MSRDFNHAKRILELENICKENPKLSPYYVKLSDEIEKLFKTALDEIIKNNPDFSNKLMVLYNINTPNSPYEDPLRK